MTIRPVRAPDAAEWLRMRMALWPVSEPDKEAGEIAHFLADPPRPALPALHAAFVCERPEGGLCGMVEASARSYADGCATGPAGYLEAWYVAPMPATGASGGRWWRRPRHGRASAAAARWPPTPSSTTP